MSLSREFIPAGIALVSAVSMLILRSIALRFLQRRVERAHAGNDEAMIRSLKAPSIYDSVRRKPMPSVVE